MSVFILKLLNEIEPLRVVLTIDAFYIQACVDLILLTTVYFLFRRIHFIKSYRSYATFKKLGHVRFLFQFNFGLFVDFVRLISIFFAVSWWARWLNPDFILHDIEALRLYLSYLDSFLFCLMLTIIFNPERASRLLNKINLTNHRIILFQFLAAVVIGAVLLLLPLMLQEGQSLSVVDALFLSVSALSVTGLSPVDISVVLNFWGQCVLLILIQLGGLGVIVLTMGLTSAFRRRLSLNDIKLSQSNFDGCYVGNASTYLKKVVILTLLFEMLGAFIIYLSLPTDESSRIFSAIFHAISAFCNAGFSLYSNNLQESVFTTLGLSAICLLIVVGGLGFPALIELTNKVNRKSMQNVILSPQTRLTLNLTIILFVSGAVLFYFLIQTNHVAIVGWSAFFQSVFYSVSSRTAGFNLLPLENFGIASQLIVVLLMFIGANPSSTGGGVKTTTIGVLVASITSYVRNKNQILIYQRAVSTRILQRAIAIVGIYIAVATTAVILLAQSETVNFFGLVFEVVSALSTVGLSLSVTPQLSFFGKIVIIILMIFGRIGLLTLVTASTGEVNKSKVYYPEDNFFVG